MMDAVITYVNMADPFWQADFERTTGVPVQEKRFRDWGTLPFLLRGISECMPFVEKVHLVLSRRSQAPAFLSDQVHIVLHEDIIPPEFLPTFNSCTIEMFLHRIPGLPERFLYFNDDMFPLLPSAEEDFFPDGKGAIGFSRHLFAPGLYKKQTRNSDRLARQALGLKPSPVFIRPQHVPSPMLRSVSEEAFRLQETEIRSRLSPLRTEANLNQYYFLDYLYHSGRAVNRRLGNKHFSLATATPGAIREFLTHPTHAFACINDVHLSEAQFSKCKEAILEGFRSRFPEPSRFERNADER